MADETPDSPEEIAATATARAHAESLGVDMTKVRATGKDGKITKSDIEAALAARPSLLGASSGSDVAATKDGLPEVEAFVGHDAATGKYLVSITTRHPDPTVVAVNGRAVWEGNS